MLNNVNLRNSLESWDIFKTLQSYDFGAIPELTRLSVLYKKTIDPEFFYSTITDIMWVLVRDVKFDSQLSLLKDTEISSKEYYKLFSINSKGILVGSLDNSTTHTQTSTEMSQFLHLLKPNTAHHLCDFHASKTYRDLLLKSTQQPTGGNSTIQPQDSNCDISFFLRAIDPKTCHEPQYRSTNVWLKMQECFLQHKPIDNNTAITHDKIKNKVSSCDISFFSKAIDPKTCHEPQYRNATVKFQECILQTQYSDNATAIVQDNIKNEVSSFEVNTKLVDSEQVTFSQNDVLSYETMFKTLFEQFTVKYDISREIFFQLDLSGIARPYFMDITGKAMQVLLAHAGLLQFLFYFLLCFLIPLLIVILARLITYFSKLSLNIDNKDSIEKKTGFECGFEPFQQTRTKFYIKFYKVGLLFILFDLELIFFYPVTYLLFTTSDNFLFFWLFFFYILILNLGILLEWNKDILDW